MRVSLFLCLYLLSAYHNLHDVINITYGHFLANLGIVPIATVTLLTFFIVITKRKGLPTLNSTQLLTMCLYSRLEY